MKDISPAVQKVLGVILLALSLAMVSTFSERLWRMGDWAKDDFSKKETFVHLSFDGVLKNWHLLGPLDQQVIWYPITILPVALAFSLLVDIHGTFLTYMAFAKWNFISWWIAFTVPFIPVWLVCDALNTPAPTFIIANIIALVIAVGLPLIGYLDEEKRAFYKKIRLQ